MSNRINEQGYLPVCRGDCLEKPQMENGAELSTTSPESRSNLARIVRSKIVQLIFVLLLVILGYQLFTRHDVSQIRTSLPPVYDDASPPSWVCAGEKGGACSNEGPQ